MVADPTLRSRDAPLGEQMRRMTLELELLSYWHAGTGRGDGEQADAVVCRSPGGLPFVPGRSVKGLVRSAAALGAACGMLDPGDVTAWFGTALVDGGSDDRTRRLEQARFRTEPGVLRFSSATMGAAWEAWGLHADGEARAPLFSRLATTRIKDGIAEDRTLRTVEVAVPMALRGTIDGPDGGWTDGIRAVLPLIRGLGTGRNRGLGRVAAREIR